jgi:hypothetical protein
MSHMDNNEDFNDFMARMETEVIEDIERGHPVDRSAVAFFLKLTDQERKEAIQLVMYTTWRLLQKNGEAKSGAEKIGV